MFVGFGVIHFCIKMEGTHATCLLKRALTNENKSRNTSCSVPKLSLVLGGLSLPLPDSVAWVGYLFLCSSQENLVFTIFWNFESLSGKGLSSLPCPEKLCRQALVGWPLCWLHGCRSWQWALLKLGLVVPLFNVYLPSFSKWFSEASTGWVWWRRAGLKSGNFSFEIGCLAAWKFRKCSLWRKERKKERCYWANK